MIGNTIPAQSTDLAQLDAPPHSIETECVVLGTLLLINETWDQVANILLVADFHLAEHRRIYTAIGTLIDANKPADVITVSNFLKKLE